jgi:hypothetical protein
MTTRTADELIAEYLGRLEAAAAGLPPGRREELLEEIRAHIDVGLSVDSVGSSDSAGGAGPVSGDDPVAVRRLLDRLGDPEEIVAAARDNGPAAAPSGTLTRPSIAHEVTAVALLTLGSLIPVIGWLVGAILLWSSRRWRLAEKLVATLIVPGGPGLAAFVLLRVPSKVCTSGVPGPIEYYGDTPPPVPPAVETCTGFAFSPGVGIAVAMLTLVGPLVVGGYLLHRALTRVDREPPVPVAPEPRAEWGGVEIAAVLLLGPGTILLPVIGPAVGLTLAWISARWTRSEKFVATGLGLVPALLLVALVFPQSLFLPFLFRS